MDTSSNNKWREGRRTRRLSFIVLLCILVVAVGILSLALNRSAQVNRLELSAAQISTDLSGHVAELHTLINALKSIHQVSVQESQTNLITLTEQLLEQHPVLDGIGRYAIVPLEQRAAFEAGMEEKGLYDFRISDVTENGRVASDLRPLSLPVSTITPMKPALLGLIGSDLAINKELFAELLLATRENRSVITQLPSYWHAENHLVMFTPTYRGIHAPVEPEEREQQSDGGYVIMIDPTALISADIKEDTTLNFSIDVDSALGSWPVLSQRGTTSVDGVLYTSLKPHTTVSLYDLGTSKISLTVTGAIGFSVRYLYYAIFALAGVIALFVLAFLLDENRKRTEQERIRSRESLFKEREKSDRTLKALSDAVISVDDQARIQHVNPAGAKLLSGHTDWLFNPNSESTADTGNGANRRANGERTEASANDLSGQAFDECLQLKSLGSGGAQLHLLDLIDQMGSNDRADFELSVLSDNYADKYVHATLSRTVESDDGDTAYTVILRDVSAEMHLRQALERQANHDALTGCTNRHYFETRLEELVSIDSDKANRSALLYIDLDQFKIVNDTAGHNAGDQLLISITERISKIIRPQDSLSRIGGDEFGVLITDVDKDQATVIANTIYGIFENFVFIHDNHSFPVRASLGLVHFSETAATSAEVMAASDLACYAAKDRGRNQLFVYSATDVTMEARTDELTWLGRLHSALENDLFRLHAQPIAKLTHGRQVTRYEFLLRLADDTGKEISPWQIIKAAERYDLMRDLDRWVVNRAMERIGLLDNLDDVIFSINLSGQSAADSSLPDFIKQQYAEHNINPASICFEITETAAIANLSTAKDLIECIRSLGSKVALDDFGSGLSSFGYLKNLPVNMVKIDGQFIQNLAECKIDQAMVKSIHDVAQAMGLETVAEFVESEAIVKVLIGIGVDYAQGYYIGEPKPLAESLAALRYDAMSYKKAG